MDILEAKGKTFDKTKDYMVRPIDIIIADGEVKIVDVKITESTIDKIVAEHYGSYEMLTPGFIDDIILLNSVIEEAYFKDSHLYMKISRIEVKPGHPENTLFLNEIINKLNKYVLLIYNLQHGNCSIIDTCSMFQFTLS